MLRKDQEERIENDEAPPSYYVSEFLNKNKPKPYENNYTSASRDVASQSVNPSQRFPDLPILQPNPYISSENIYLATKNRVYTVSLAVLAIHNT